MDFRQLSDTVTVSPQIAVGDMAGIKEAGYRAILCNRPNDEGADQPPFHKIAAAAQAYGIEVRYVPVQPGTIEDKDVAAFHAAIGVLPHPVLAYCRSGMRSATLWALHEGRTRPVDEILDVVQAAGYDLSGMTGRILKAREFPTDIGEEAEDA